MRAEDGQRLRDLGQLAVEKQFVALGWGPIRNPSQDFGTDLYCQVRDARRFERGLIIGVQVKTGRSYFDRPKRVKRELVGWWYPENKNKHRDKDHFDYWATHTIPHILVLHEPDSATSYWVRVTRDSIVSTGDGNKILVPKDQVLDGSRLDDLYAIAAEQRPTVSWEGSIWRGGLEQLAPGERLRFALLAPRLVAPHQNAGYQRPIGAVEAVALCAQGRVNDLDGFAEKFSEVPDLQDLRGNMAWDWRFAAALRARVCDGDVEQLREAAASAPDPARRAAAVVALACGLYGVGRLDDAMAELSKVITGDASPPVDHAWLLVQRSRFDLELGEIGDARSDAMAAAKCLAGSEGDVSASAVRAAAASLVWSAAAWQQGNLGDVVAAADTPTAWWRAQTIASALREGVDRILGSWVDDGTITFIFEDRLHNGLLAAVMASDLSGAHGNWRAELALLAKEDLLAAHHRADLGAISEAIDDLRRSGDHPNLKRAAGRIRSTGPLSALGQAVRRVGLGLWTRTTVRSNLVLWDEAGDLLDTELATAAAAVCLDGLSGRPAPQLKPARLDPAVYLGLELASSLRQLLPAADDATTERTAEWLATLPDEPHPLLCTELPSLVGNLRIGVLDGGQRNKLRRLANRIQHERVSTRILAWLAAHDDDEASDALLRSAQQGSVEALRAIGDISQLGSDGAALHIERLASGCRGIIEAANGPPTSARPFGGGPSLAALALLNLAFPSQAHWDVLFQILAHPVVFLADKSAILDVASARPARLPEAVAERLVSMLPTLYRSRGLAIPGESSSVEGAAGRLSIALGHDVDAAMVRLAAGGRDGRVNLAQALSTLDRPDVGSLLATMAFDPDTEVRFHAVAAIAGRVAQGRSGNADRAVVERLVDADETLSAEAILHGSRQVARSSEEMRALLERLSGHPAGAVRATARLRLAKWSSVAPSPHS